MWVNNYLHSRTAACLLVLGPDSSQFTIFMIYTGRAPRREIEMWKIFFMEFAGGERCFRIMILIPVSVCFDIILFLLFRRMKLDKQMYEIKFKNQILRT